MNNLIKGLFILLAVLVSTANSFSQTFEWEKIVGSTSAAEHCFASARVNSNLYVFGGYYYNRTPFLMAGLLIFTNASGDTIKTNIYPQFYNGQVYDVAVNSDSTLVVSGIYDDTINNTTSTFVFKADMQGNIIWQQQTRQFAANKIIIVPDGYLAVAPGFFSIAKLDNRGNLLWRKVVDSTGSSFDITLLNDGSYLASGSIRDPNSHSGQSNYYKTSPYLVQLNPNGDTIRTKVLGTIYDHDLLNTARQTADGGLILAGRFVPNQSNTRMQGMVIKLDSSWNLQWQRYIYPPRGAYDQGCELYNIQETIDSSFIVSGYYMDSISTSPYGDDNGYVAKINKTGNMVWERQFQAGTVEWFKDMVYNDNGSAIFSGYRNFSSGPDFYLVKLSGLSLPYKPNYCNTLPFPDFTASLLTNDTVQFSDLSAAGTRYGTISTWEWHLGDGTISTDSVPKHKYSQTLQQLYNTPVTLIVTNNSGCRDSITLYPFRTLSVSKQLPNVQVQLYPNPAREQTTITLSGYKHELSMEMLDVTGRKVSVPVQQSLQGESQQLQLNTSNLPKGLYLYRLVHKGNLVSTGKLVKE